MSRVARLLVASALVAVGACRSEVRLADPPTLASRDGALMVRLEAAPGRYAIGGEPFGGMLYNGAYIPPLLRVRPGDTLTIELDNHLHEPTNLHFHGFHVAPRGNGDNPFVHVHPGTSFPYRVAIPTGHSPGLFWYHSHAHGRAGPQIVAGLSGGLIVEGSDRVYPFLKRLRERVLLLKHVPDPRAEGAEIVTVNGQRAPAIPIRPGEAQYWRIANIGADLFLRLRLEGLPFYVVATDGQHLSRPVRWDEVALGPGSRVEGVVIGGPPGRYPFKSVSLLVDEERPPEPEYRLATVISEGPAADMAAVEARVKAQTADAPRAIDAIRRSPIAHRRAFTFSRDEERSRFYINGQLYDERRTDVEVSLGDTEEWTIRNEDNQLHNFHIHQTAFAVTAINGVPQNADSLYDTFTVPPAAGGKPGEITILVPFTDPIILGRFVFHCHAVKHEDRGMMQTIEVRPRSRPPAR